MGAGHHDIQELLQELGPKLYRYLWWRCANPDLAEELVQETVVRMLAGFSGFRGEATVSTWAFAIARRVWANYVRGLKKAAAREFPVHGPGPEEIVLERESRRLARQALELLSEDDRAVLVLREFEGMSYAAIGARLGLTVPAVKVRIYRARKRLAGAYTRLAGGGI